MNKQLIGRVVRFSGESYPEEVAKALEIFFDKNEEEYDLIYTDQQINMLFNEWLIFDYKIDNKYNFIQKFLQDNFDDLSEIDVREYTEMLDNIYSFFRVEKIWKNKGLLLKDMINGENYKVKEKGMTRDVHKGDLVFLRIARIGKSFYIISGTSSAIIDLDINEKITREWKNDNLSPKIFYRLIYKPVPKKDKLLLKDKNKDIDPLIAEQEFQEFLDKTGLGEMLSLELVKKWIYEMETKGAFIGDQIELSNKLILLLLENYKRDDDADDLSGELVRVLNNLINVTKRKKLKGKSSQELKLEIKKNPSKIKLPKNKKRYSIKVEKISMEDSGKYFDEGIVLLHREKFSEARKMMEKGAKVAIEKKYLFGFEYRFLANYAISYVAQGDLEIAIEFLKMALELNPKYRFGRKVYKEINSMLEQRKQYEVMSKFLEGSEIWEKEDIFGRWTEKKMLQKLREIGVRVDVDELMKYARKDLSFDEYYNQKIEPQIEKVENKLTVSMNVHFALIAIWIHRRDKENEFIRNYLLYIFNNLETFNEEYDVDKMEIVLNDILFYATSAPRKIWEEARNFNVDWIGFINMLNDLWLAGDLVEIVESIVTGINKKINDDLVRILQIIENISDESIKFEKEFYIVADRMQYGVAPFIMVASYFGTIGKFDYEEKFLLEAYERIEENGEDNLLFSQRDVVLDYLEAIYTEDKKNKLKLKNIQKIKKQLEKQINQEPKQIQEKINFQKIKFLDDKIENSNIAKRIKNNPLKLHYELVKSSGINLSTKKMTEDETFKLGDKNSPAWNDYSERESDPIINKQKVGRNDLCPCGSGKKYKKCCLDK